MIMDRDRYWAAQDIDDLGTAIEERFRAYQTALGSSLRGRRIYQARARWIGVDGDSGSVSSDVQFIGDDGEQPIANVNHFRSLVRSLRALATSSRPAFSAMATDDSAEAAASCELAEQVWDYELELGLERVLGRADDRMLVEGEAGIGVYWDPDAGRTLGVQPLYETDPVTGWTRRDPATGEPVPELDADGAPRELAIREGGIVYEAHGPYDIARDPDAPDLTRLPWVIVRRRAHRFDVLASHSEGTDAYLAILGARGPGSPHLGPELRQGSRGVGGHGDHIYVLELYHERSAAMPEGRYARVVGGVVIEEGPLPYEHVPVILRAPSEEMDRAEGYTDAWDLLGLSQAIDMVVSDLINHSERFGRMPALIPEGADVDAGDLVGGGEVRWKWQEGMPPPQWMTPPPIAGGLFQFLEWAEKTLQILSGVNSVVRGDPGANLKSGAALALVSAMSAMHASAFQGAAADMRRAVATAVIETYRTFATHERLLVLTGGYEQGTVRSFRGDDLRPVRRIRATLANPLLRTIPGKKEVIDDLMQRFPAEPPVTRGQYLSFLETGRFEPVFRADEAQRRLVMIENERFLRGDGVFGRATDHHECHIREHAAIIDGRGRYELAPEQIAAIEEHILWHGQTWIELSNTNPALLAATNQRPAPMPQGPPVEPEAAGGSPPEPGDQPSALGPEVAPHGAMPVDGPEMPRMPTNPATGQRAVVPGQPQ